MTPDEQQIMLSALDDVRAERDRLLKEVKPHQPIINIDFSIFGKIWDDIMGVSRSSESWSFGLWLLLATFVGTFAFCTIYSVLKLWALVG